MVAPPDGSLRAAGGAVLAAALAAGVAPAPAAAQGLCDDASATVSAGAPSLEGFALLFQQAGVTFYASAPAADPPHVARVVVRNGNRYPVEVGYSLLLQLDGPSLPPSIGLDRHCARIPAGEYALTSDDAPGAAIGVRMRNLTIANLAATSAPVAAAGRSPAAGPAATPAPLQTPTIDVTVVDTTPATAAVPATATPPAEAPPSAAQPSTDTASSGAPVRGVGEWALEATYAVFFILSALVLVVAGLGLALPIVAATVLLVGAGFAALARSGSRRPTA